MAAMRMAVTDAVACVDRQWTGGFGWFGMGVQFWVMVVGRLA
jgi:hypothetical protein